MTETFEDGSGSQARPKGLERLRELFRCFRIVKPDLAYHCLELRGCALHVVIERFKRRDFRAGGFQLLFGFFEACFCLRLCVFCPYSFLCRFFRLLLRCLKGLCRTVGRFLPGGVLGLPAKLL